MRRLFNAGFCVLLLTAPGRAQEAIEVSFLERAVKQLNGYATLCLRNQFPRRAREVWLEIIAEYAPDDFLARRNLGFVRVGAGWAPKAGFEFPDGDRPDVTAAKLLRRRWDSLTEDLGKAHRELALELQTAGLQERSLYHFDRTLRFLPGDPTAAAARGLESFEGFYGTPIQLELFKRSRLMERAVIRLAQVTYDVEVLPPEANHPWVESAGVAHQGVRSEHFTIWGDWGEEVLVEIANYCERSLAFCEEAFAGYEGFPPKTGIVRTQVHLTSRETWAGVIEDNRARLGDHTDFVLEYAYSTTFGFGPEQIHISGQPAVETAYDMAVRWVAEDYAGFKTAALKEGIGHAVVGKFFGRNLVYSVAPEKRPRTAAGWQPRPPLMPDLASWAERALESAWQRNSVGAAELPLIKASNFSDDDRVKAWSFSDFLLRRDPELLLALDKTVADGAGHEAEVIEKFQEATGGSILALDNAWRRFWTEDTPLNRAIHNKMTPLEAVSKAAPSWLAAFNELRVKYGSAPVGWLDTLSEACKQHAEYLKVNRRERGFGVENTQAPGSVGFTNAGRTFAQTAIVSTRGARAPQVMEGWIDLPGYRDAILNYELRNIGLYVDGSIAVFDVERGWREDAKSQIEIYPSPLNDVGDPVPRGFEIKRLGPAMEGLVGRRSPGRARAAIGYPISIHFYRGLPRGRNAVQCTVTVKGELVAGFLHRAYESGDRLAAAQGMLVFYPFQPMRTNSEVKVKWTYRGNDGERHQVAYAFFTK